MVSDLCLAIHSALPHALSLALAATPTSTMMVQYARHPVVEELLTFLQLPMTSMIHSMASLALAEDMDPFTVTRNSLATDRHQRTIGL